MGFNTRVRGVRNHFALSQSEFGKEIGKSLRTIQTWESGANTPTLDTIKELSTKLDINHNWLLTGLGKMLLTDNQKELGIIGYDGVLIRNVIFEVENFLDQSNLSLPPDKKADLVLLFLYRIDNRDGKGKTIDISGRLNEILTLATTVEQ